MPNFAEQLNAVRKQRNITQEQLAKALNVSRPTISHWENGRAIPDVDTIKQISRLMDYDFLALDTDTAGSPEPAADEAASAPAEQPQPQPAPRKKPIALLAALGVLILCVVLGVVCFLSAGTSTAQALVTVTPQEDPVHIRRTEDFANGAAWVYVFDVAETAGVPFTAQSATLYYVHSDGNEEESRFSADDITSWWGTNVIQEGAGQFFSGSLPMQAMHGVRLVLAGVDANGNALSFEGSVSLSDEYAH